MDMTMRGELTDLPAAVLCVAPARITATALRAPAAAVGNTPFGRNLGRQCVLVRVTDADGAEGWGETWASFPSGVGAEHRAGLIEVVLAPLVLGRRFAGPAEVFSHLERATHLLGLQAGEPGPLANAIAGIDIALWDLVARRAGRPLWRLFGSPSDGAAQVPAYASGLAPEAIAEALPGLAAGGYRALKVRLWGAGADHAASLRRVRERIGPDWALMADANQTWSIADAARLLPRFAGIGLGWVEEPIAADAPPADWRRLAALSPAPLAGGENLRGEEFDAALAEGALGVVQPDIAKWGGFSGCLPLARRIRAVGQRYCPHFLGGAVGLLASAHLLAAAGGDGLLEVDAGKNPLREALGKLPAVRDGSFPLPEAPGLGFVPDAEAVAAFRVRG
jgi:D-galactarolactone cycloisomerase